MLGTNNLVKKLFIFVTRGKKTKFGPIFAFSHCGPQLHFMVRFEVGFSQSKDIRTMSGNNTLNIKLFVVKIGWTFVPIGQIYRMAPLTSVALTGVHQLVSLVGRQPGRTYCGGEGWVGGGGGMRVN